jgi:hypothetical protein
MAFPVWVILWLFMDSGVHHRRNMLISIWCKL